MSELQNKEILPKITIRYNGLFDFDGMYAAIVDWAKNYNYFWNEKTYKFKVPSPAGAEKEFEWTMTKKVTEYVHFAINITAHIWDMQTVNVNVDGKIKKYSNARLYIQIDPVLSWDYQNRWGKSNFTKKIGEWYFRLIFDSKMADYYDTLWYRCNNLQALIKKFFDMQTKKHPYKKYLGEN